LSRLNFANTIRDHVHHRWKRDRRRARSSKLTSKRTLSKRKIAEMNITEFLSMIYISDLRFNEYSFRSLLDIYYIERCWEYHLTISLKTGIADTHIAESDIIEMIDQRKLNRRKGRSSNRRLPNFGIWLSAMCIQTTFFCCFLM